MSDFGYWAAFVGTHLSQRSKFGLFWGKGADFWIRELESDGDFVREPPEGSVIRRSAVCIYNRRWKGNVL